MAGGGGTTTVTPCADAGPAAAAVSRARLQAIVRVMTLKISRAVWRSGPLGAGDIMRYVRASMIAACVALVGAPALVQAQGEPMPAEQQQQQQYAVPSPAPAQSTTTVIVPA